MKIKIILVGGFLGAGKTSLLWEAASRMTARGMKVAFITNDQASELVDSAFLLRTGLTVAEVSGSCFCCNFNGFAHSIAKNPGQNHPGGVWDCRSSIHHNRAGMALPPAWTPFADLTDSRKSYSFASTRTVSSVVAVPMFTRTRPIQSHYLARKPGLQWIATCRSGYSYNRPPNR